MGIGKLRRLLTLLLACSLLWSATFAGAAPLYAGVKQQGYTYEECSDINVDSLRTEIDALAMTVLAEGAAGIDIPAIVDQQWRALNMDAIVDDVVSESVARVQREEAYWDRFLSGWSVEKAREFATVIADDAFGSQEFKAALERLSVAVASELTAELITMSARSASTALLCMQAYVGEQYSKTLFALFEEEISTGVAGAELTGDGELDLSALGVHNKALTGVSVIIVSQLVRRLGLKLSRELGERVAGRIAGRVLGRLGSSLIPLVGWIIGAGLIAWDIWDGSKGALPQIEESLTSEDVKAAVRAEISDSISESLDEEMDDIAGAIAADLVDEWRNFCSRHPYLCSLPEQNETFKLVLDATSLDGLDKLSGLVDLYMQTLGEISLGEALDSGAFEHLLAEPVVTYEIFTATGSPDEAQAWADLAGDEIEGVVALKLYELTTPAAMTPARVADLLAMTERDAISTLVQLEPAEMDAVLDVRPADVDVVAAQLSADDLRWLISRAEQSDKSTLPQLMHGLSVGALTLEALQSPTPAPTPTVRQAMDSAATDDVVSPKTGGAAGDATSQARNPNPILIGSIILLIVLLLLGFAVVIIMKRNKKL